MGACTCDHAQYHAAGNCLLCKSAQGRNPCLARCPVVAGRAFRGGAAPAELHDQRQRSVLRVLPVAQRCQAPIPTAALTWHHR